MDEDDFGPIADADTGVDSSSDEEVKAMFEEDRESIKTLEHHEQVFVLMNRMLDTLEREDNAPSQNNKTASILREKVLRGMQISDTELDNVVLTEAFRLMFGKITTKEFLRRMLTVSDVTDLDL